MPQPVRTAHILEEKWRSKDVRLQEKADFSSMLLSDRVLAGLEKSGFKIPSPIQIESIPVGRFGRDLVVQAKSGTGKTLVFTIIALEALLDIKVPQVLILAPTREIATQICDVIKSVGCEFKHLKCRSFIGGLPISKDAENCIGCQIVVGTPGRIKQLISNGNLPVHSIRMFVLDEADVLLDPSFKIDIDFIFMNLPKEKQVIATSATYPKELKHFIGLYFRDAFLARLNVHELALLGIIHYIQKIEATKLPHLAYQLKLAALEKVLNAVQFTQCLVFCNLISRVEPLCYDIRTWNFSTAFISSAKEQGDRLKAIDCLKRFRCKVLVSSDVTARGIDAEKVDLIINFDKPRTLETYMHRCGRAGRYGSKGVVITFLTTEETDSFENLKKEGSFQAFSLPDLIPPNLISIRPKEADFLDCESLENEDTDTDLIEIKNGEDVSENNHLPQEKMLSHSNNSSERVIKLGSTESNGNVVEKELVSNNNTECNVENNYIVENVNSNGVNQKHTNENLNINADVSLENENASHVSLEFTSVKCNEKHMSNGIPNEEDINNISVKEETNINNLDTVTVVGKPDYSNDVEVCENKTDADVCDETQEVQEKTRSRSADVLESHIEDSSNVTKGIKQKLLTNSSDSINENLNKNEKLDIEVTFATNKNLSKDNSCLNVNPITENESKNSIVDSVDNSVTLESQLNDAKSNKAVLNKIQVPVLQFLIDYDKNKCTQNVFFKDKSLKEPNKGRDTHFRFLKSTKIVGSSQIKEVRENLCKFYQNIFKSYQSTIMYDETFDEIKLMSQNKIKNSQPADDENRETCKKTASQDNKDIDKTSDSESDLATDTSDSDKFGFDILNRFLLQSKERNKTGSGDSGFKKQTSASSDETSDSESDLSIDTSDSDKIAFHILDRFVSQSKDCSTTGTPDTGFKKPSLSIKSPNSDTASTGVKSDVSNSSEHNRQKFLNKKLKQLKRSTASQRINREQYDGEKQQVIKETCSPVNSSLRSESNSDFNVADDGKQHGARRKTFKKCQTYVNNQRKYNELTSESEESCSQSSVNHNPSVKKNNMRETPSKVKYNKKRSHLNGMTSERNSHSCFHHNNQYQHFQTHVPQNVILPRDTHCSNHRCHSIGSSLCFNDQCGNWYGKFLNQLSYIQKSSRTEHQMNYYY